MIFGASLLAAVAITLGVQEAPAEARPPSWIEGTEWTATTQSDPVPPLQLGNFAVLLETTALADVRKEIGSGTMYRNGDAAESITWLCYNVARAASTQVVWLSSSEMGGGEIVDGVTALISDSASPAPKNCATLPAKYEQIRLKNGIWLGSTAAQVRAAFGQPHEQAETWSYVFEGKSGSYDVYSNVSFKIRDGKVVALDCSRLTSS